MSPKAESASALVSMQPSTVKRIHVAEKLPNVPKPLKLRDWRETALAYDRFVFDDTLEGEHLPLIWKDRTHRHMEEDSFGLMSYVGKFEQGPDGTQEAVNVMGAVLGATLVGVNKRDRFGGNYVNMLRNFFHSEQRVFVSKPATGSGDTFWYEVQAHVLYYALAAFYPDEPGMAEIMRTSADRWLEALEALRDREGKLQFRCTAFDFGKMEAVDNGKWREPDAAAGIAMLLHMAYRKFGDAKYLDAAMECLAFLEDQLDNPYYELLMYYAPYLAARLNAEHGKDFDIGKFINWIFDGGTVIRPGWGTVAERWGNYDMHGLIGSLADNGGYAFAMNGFHLFSVLAPLVRYDPRYAHDIGKWMLNLANQSRYFYADELPAANQSCPDWAGDPGQVIPYEGIRKEYEGKTPYASGDATVMNWGALDFSLYSGSYAGFVGGIVKKTNVEGILQIDCLRTDYYRADAYPTYLYYNPFGSPETVEIEDLGDMAVDLLDIVRGAYLAKGVKDRSAFVLESDQAAVVLVLPSGATPEDRDGQLWMDGVFVAPAPKPAINLCGVQDREEVSGIVKFKVEIGVPQDDAVRRIRVSLGATELFSGKDLPESFMLDTEEFHNGIMHLRAELDTVNDRKDSSEIGLLIRN
ncbi:hypothetical protein SAMN05216312_101154 [Cohnella sp. OV330]|uniref:hypothetical protein n=1 Tax=Cohnella sp. OV330 TaxID=1855288 RepID=UPI0008E72E9A|nr:hypothetical protein [Cohnella sp. OV330]SFA72781.1 hypothetical protein SAMN05216312_101154 [Cohnella sp. OV330]